jgi:integrase
MLLQKQKTYTYEYQESYNFSIPNPVAATVVKEIDNPTLINYYRYYIQQQQKLVAVGKKEPGTIVTYETRLNIITEFIIYNQGNFMYPKDFTISVIREFEIFLLARKKHSNDYAMKNIQLLGTVLKIALEHNAILFNPVTDLYDFHYERAYDGTFLEIEELRKLQKKRFRQERLQRVSDVFLFCCYTGLSYVDVYRFRRSLHIVTGIDSKPWILLKRKKNTRKTTEDTFIPLLPPALAILEKYGNEKLPVISLGKMNSYIKEVCEIVGIEKDVSTKVARKTFGMLLYEEYAVPLPTVSKMLGHSSTRTTEQWYVKTRMKKIALEMKNSDSFFSDPPQLRKSA